jgi:hypothetical protein
MMTSFSRPQLVLILLLTAVIVGLTIIRYLWWY